MTWLDRNGDWLARAAEEWRPRRVEPLRIRVFLRSSGMAYDPYNGIQIEGLLQHVVVMLATGRMPSDVFADKPRDIATDIQIPVADTVIDGFPIAMASWGHFPREAIESVRWLRKRARTSVLNAPSGRGIIVIAGGAYKSLNLPIARMTTAWIDFYVRGDAERLRRLLAAAASIGRHRGHSEIMCSEITPDERDSSLWVDGHPQRSIPVPCATPEARTTTTRAPYHVAASMTTCLVPEACA